MPECGAERETNEYKLVSSSRRCLAQDVATVPSIVSYHAFTFPLHSRFLLSGGMAHHASGLPTTTISADGVIYPPWYNVDDNVLWFQPAHGADVTQESPTIVGSSTRGLSGSPVQLSSPASTTRPASRSNARSLNPNPNPNPRATKKLRLHRTKVCAECKRSRTKCVLGDGNSCSRCDCLGVRCKLPTARRSHEKELKRMSGKLPRERCVL